MEVDAVFVFRLFNIALTVFVISVGLLKIAWRDPDKGRQLRIAGLCVLGLVAALNAYDRRFEEFSYRIPLNTIGLLLAAAGLHLFHINRDENGKALL